MKPIATVSDRYSMDGHSDEITALLPVGTELFSAAQVADAQAEIARLRGALEEINRTTFDDDANRIAHSALQK